MNKSFNKFGICKMGSARVSFYYDLPDHKPKTKRLLKRLAAQATRRYIKNETLIEFCETLQNNSQ